MLCGIDPEALNGLANSMADKAGSLRLHARSALDSLHRNGKPAEAQELSTVVSRVEQWSVATAQDLRWRSEAIRRGRTSEPNVLHLMRAEFHAQAFPSPDTVDAAYRRWVATARASQLRVDDSVSDISRWLDQSWTDWDVTNNDLHNIWSALKSLTGNELDRVIAALSPAQLERWIEEMGNRINGFSLSEKAQVFALLATNASGESLGKVHDAIVSAGDSRDSIAIGTAVSDHSPDLVISNFVNFVVTRDLSGHRYSTVAPTLALTGVDDTKAVGSVLNRTVSTDDVLERIVADSVALHDADGDVNPLDSLVDTIARSDNSHLKAIAFAAIADLALHADVRVRGLLRDRHRIFDNTTTDYFGTKEDVDDATRLLRSAESGLLSSAAEILASDAAGVVKGMATIRDPDGSTMTAYFRELIDRELTAQLGQVITALRGGDVVDPVTFSGRGLDPGYPYPHAQNLGYVAGALRLALEEYADDAKQDIDWITGGAKILTVGLGVAYSAVLAVNQMVGLTLEGVAEWATTDFWAARSIHDIDIGLREVLETVVTNLQPPFTPEDGPAHLGDALQWWDHRYDSVWSR